MRLRENRAPVPAVDNNSGQLGNGTYETRPEPARAGDDMDWMALAAGYGHTCGVKLGGEMLCWGYVEEGRLCSETVENPAVPTQVTVDSDWLSVTAGMSHTCAIRRPFQLTCCGYNEYGQLGDGTLESRSSPTRVPCR